MLSNIMVAIMVILALAAGIWCVVMENGKDDPDKKEKR